jgi:hypothetical protein
LGSTVSFGLRPFHFIFLQEDFLLPKSPWDHPIKIPLVLDVRSTCRLGDKRDTNITQNYASGRIPI